MAPRVPLRAVLFLGLGSSASACTYVKQLWQADNSRHYVAVGGGGSRTNGGEWGGAVRASYHYAPRVLVRPGAEVIAKAARIEPAAGIELDGAGALQIGFHGGYGVDLDADRDGLFGTFSIRTPLTEGFRLRRGLIPPGRTPVSTERQSGFDLVVSYTVRADDVPDAWLFSLSFDVTCAREPATPSVTQFPPDQE